MPDLGKRWWDSALLLSCFGIVLGFFATAGGATTVATLHGNEPARSAEVAVRGKSVERDGEQQVREAARRSTVRVATETCGGSREGLGVSVNGWILTTRHLVEGGSIFTVTGADGTELDVVNVEVSARFDLAALQVANPVNTPVSLGSSRAEMGTPLTVVRGLAFGLEAESTAIGGEERGTGPNDPPVVQHLVTHAVGGDSGGGVFSDDGHLVGLVYAQRLTDRTALVMPIDQVVEEFGRLVPLEPAAC